MLKSTYCALILAYLLQDFVEFEAPVVPGPIPKTMIFKRILNVQGLSEGDRHLAIISSWGN